MNTICANNNSEKKLHVSVVPVCGESGEREHGDPHRGELDKRNQFAPDAAKEPLVHQVTAGVHRGAGQQQQHVAQSQAGQEQVGHGAHGLHRQTRPHQRHVPHQTHHDDDPVDGGDGDSGWPDVVPVRSARGFPNHSGDIRKQSPAVLQVQGEWILQRHGSDPVRGQTLTALESKVPCCWFYVRLLFLCVILRAKMKLKPCPQRRCAHTCWRGMKRQRLLDWIFSVSHFLMLYLNLLNLQCQNLHPSITVHYSHIVMKSFISRVFFPIG